MTVRRYASSPEADRDDLSYRRQMPNAERVLHTWRLSVELWRLQGGLPDESGLCRSVARVIAADVRFLVVGAYALAIHGRPRATGALDV